MKKSLMKNMVISLLFSALLGYAVFLFLQYGAVFSAMIRNIILGCIAVLFICIWWIFIADAISARRHSEDDEDYDDEDEDDAEYFGGVSAHDAQNPAAGPKPTRAEGLVMRPAAPAENPPLAATQDVPVPEKSSFDISAILNLNEGGAAPAQAPIAAAQAPATAEQTEPTAPQQTFSGVDDTKEVPARHLKSRLDVPVTPLATPAASQTAAEAQAPAAAPQATPATAPTPAVPAAAKPAVAFSGNTAIFSRAQTATKPAESEPVRTPKPVEAPAPAVPQPVAKPTPAAPKPVAKPTPSAPKPVEKPAPAAPKPVEKPVPAAPKPVEKPAPAAPKPVEQTTRTFAPVSSAPVEMSTRTFTPVGRSQPAPVRTSAPSINVEAIPFSEITPELIATLNEQQRAILTRRLAKEKKRREELAASRRALDAQLAAAKAANQQAKDAERTRMEVSRKTLEFATTPLAATPVEEPSPLYNTARLDADLLSLQSPPTLNIKSQDLSGTRTANRMTEAYLAKQKADQLAMMAAARRRAEREARERAEQEEAQRQEEERKALEAIKRKEKEEETRREAERLAAEERLRQAREKRAAEEKARREAAEAERLEAERKAEERRREEIRLRQEILTRDYLRRQREEAAQRESLRAAQLEAARKEVELRIHAEEAEKDRNLRAFTALRMEVSKLTSEVHRRESELARIQTELDSRQAAATELTLQAADQLVSPSYLSEVHSDRALRDEKERLERELLGVKKQLEAKQHQFELQRRREEAENKARDARMTQITRWKTQQLLHEDGSADSTADS